MRESVLSLHMKAFIWTALLLVPELVLADEIPSEMTALLADGRRLVSEWSNETGIVVALTVAVGILGVITGFLQGFSKPVFKILTVIAGALVSIITVVNNSVFDADHRTLRQSVARGEVIVRRMEFLMRDLVEAPTAEAKRSFRNDFLQLGAQMFEIKANMKRSSEAPSLTSVAYAQAVAPPWVAKVPTDPTFQFFVGLGEAKEPGEARGLSRRDALEHVERILLKNVSGTRPMTTQTDVIRQVYLRDFSEKVAEVVDFATALDRERGLYRYWMLIRVNKRFLDPGVSASLLNYGSDPPAPSGTVAKILQSAQKQYFNADRRVRVEYANVSVDQDGRGTFFFQAAAMIKARFPARAGPWVKLGFLDQSGNLIGGFRQVVEASVESCGGYQDHRVRLNESDFPLSILRQATSFTIQVPGGASPVRC